LHQWKNNAASKMIIGRITPIIQSANQRQPITSSYSKFGTANMKMSEQRRDTLPRAGFFTRRLCSGCDETVLALAVAQK
jgi:hypothetical protein